MVRKLGTYYWEVKEKYGKNFPSIIEAKKFLEKKIKKDKSILGRNKLWHTPSMLRDVIIGYYGINGRWRRGV